MQAPPPIQSVTKKESCPDSGYPFGIPVIKSLSTISFSSRAVFLVGENGCGKSTLLEAIAAALRLPAVGSTDIANDRSLEAIRSLANHLRITRSPGAPRRGFFLRAEDVLGFLRRTRDSMEEMRDLEANYSETLEGLGRQLAMGVARGQRMALENRYGEDPEALSHGEYFLRLFASRVVPGGIYLFDEPEAPLSPQRQLGFMALMADRMRDSQFIIATHSPILLGFPGAQILEMRGDKIFEARYEDLEHVALTRDFLNGPERFTRHLFDHQ